MPKYKAEKITYKKQDELMANFCNILSKLSNPKMIQDFLKDLLNRQERIMLIRRLLIAEMLEDGCTYEEIIGRMECGATTISKVTRWLNFGRNGYKSAIKAKKKK